MYKRKTVGKPTRNLIKTYRFTQKEYAWIEKQARMRNIRVSDFVRACIFGDITRSDPPVALTEDIISEELSRYEAKIRKNLVSDEYNDDLI